MKARAPTHCNKPEGHDGPCGSRGDPAVHPEFVRGLWKAFEIVEGLGVSEGYLGRPLALVEIRKLKESLEKELQRLEKESHRTG